MPAVRLGGNGSPVRIPMAGLEAWPWSEPSEEND